MSCPIGKTQLRGGCTDLGCLHHIRGNCEYLSSSGVSSVENSDERLKAVCSLYSIPERELRSSVNDVMLAVLANSFFEYLFQKPILDCKQKEIGTLLSSESKYYEWRGRSTPTFNRVCESVTTIVSKL